MRSMRIPRRSRAVVFALWANAALLLAILAVLLARPGSPSVLPAAYGHGPQPLPIAGGSGIYLMPAQFTSSSWGCYVMDVDTQILCAYKYDPARQGTLRFVAARHFRHDRRVPRFNTAPSPQEIEQLTRLQEKARRNNPDRRPQDPEAGNGIDAGEVVEPGADEGVGPAHEGDEQLLPEGDAGEVQDGEGPQDAGNVDDGGAGQE